MTTVIYQGKVHYGPVEIEKHAMQRLQERVSTFQEYRSWQHLVKTARYEEMKRIDEQEQGFKGWCHRNRKTVLIIGGTLLAAGTGYTICKNWGFIKGVFVSVKPEPILINNSKLSVKVTEPTVEILTETPETLSKISNGSEAFDVRHHIRNLPSDWKASPEKVAEAAELRINLLENQTLVDTYMKNIS